MQRLGLRDRKKLATRHALSESAFRLFAERGFDGVGVREIADAADVSTTTLFKYFPSKESLVFDEDQEIEAELVRMVRERPEGVSILEALRRYLQQSLERMSTVPERMAVMHELIAATPALAAYAREMWLRHEASLARAIAAEIGAPPDDVACAALAHFTLESRFLVARTPDPAAALDSIFALLEDGWTSVVNTRGDAPAQRIARTRPERGMRPTRDDRRRVGAHTIDREGLPRRGRAKLDD
jgi:AcrR family transcriptional regulator